jgi:hypothetical protein
MFPLHISIDFSKQLYIFGSINREGSNVWQEKELKVIKQKGGKRKSTRARYYSLYGR